MNNKVTLEMEGTTALRVCLGEPQNMLNKGHRHKSTPDSDCHWWVRPEETAARLGDRTAVHQPQDGTLDVHVHQNLPYTWKLHDQRHSFKWRKEFF